MNDWHLYVVRTVDDLLYAGIARDVERRFAEHRAAGSRAAKFFRGHPPAEVVWQVPIGSLGLALRAEHRFKRLQRSDKEALLDRDEVTLDLETGQLS